DITVTPTHVGRFSLARHANTCSALLQVSAIYFFLFFFANPATPEIYTLSLHDALPISSFLATSVAFLTAEATSAPLLTPTPTRPDRKSTRLNSSHVKISYAVFCLKKKKQQPAAITPRASTAL